MIEPARAVAAAAAVDHPSIGQAEQKRMACNAFPPVAAHGFVPCSDFTLVLKYALAYRERSHRKNAPAMNRGLPDNYVPWCFLIGFGAGIRAAGSPIQCRRV